jgi:serine phosphatase RsbU (regulator of sigma subunit)
MAKPLRSYRLWKSMQPAALRQLAVAVFLLFAVIGPLSSLMESQLHTVSWRFVIVQTLASGGMAATIIYFARKGWFAVVLSVMFWTGVTFLNSGTLSFVFDDRGAHVELVGVEKRHSPTPAATITQDDLDAIYSQRAALGGISIAFIALGYSMFLRVISKEINQRARLETEVSIARDIQESLLPPATYESPIVEASGVTAPASEVGGDFFDFIELPGGKFAAVIADVTGHGVGAGILSAMTKSALRSQLQNNATPRFLLQNLNRTIYEVSADKMFVTFVYLLIDPAGGKVSYATAGHPPLFLKPKQDGNVRRLRTVNTALGMREESPFVVDEFHLEAGSTILLYTDGIIEATDEKGEQFGADRLSTAFARATGSTRDICAGIMGEVSNYSGGKPQTDDITLVCLRLKG